MAVIVAVASMIWIVGAVVGWVGSLGTGDEEDRFREHIEATVAAYTHKAVVDYVPKGADPRLVSCEKRDIPKIGVLDVIECEARFGIGREERTLLGYYGDEGQLEKFENSLQRDRRAAKVALHKYEDIARRECRESANASPLTEIASAVHPGDPDVSVHAYVSEVGRAMCTTAVSPGYRELELIVVPDNSDHELGVSTADIWAWSWFDIKRCQDRTWLATLWVYGLEGSADLEFTTGTDC